MVQQRIACIEADTKTADQDGGRYAWVHKEQCADTNDC